MKDLSYYKDEAERMMNDDTERDNKFRAMDMYYRGEWAVPDKFKNVDWFHSIVDMGPHDALYAAARTLATLEPHPTYHPLDSTPESRARADMIERVLAWHYWRANRRGRSRITQDIVMSALRYDEVAFQVVYLPWQEKLNGRSNKQWDAGGDFAFSVHSPVNVHSVRTSYGLEHVLLAKVLPVAEICRTWGDYAKEFEKQAKEKKYRYAQYFDFTDGEYRCVWVTALSSDLRTAPEIIPQTANAEEFLIYHEQHNLPFIPWVVRSGGSAVDAEPENQRHPLLDPIYRAKMWDTSNMLNSLKVSSVIANVGQPRAKNITLDGQPPEVDMSQPGGEVNLRPGEDRQILNPPPIDQAVVQIAAELSQRISSSTLPKILQDPSASGQMAFATYNASFNAAGNALDPHRMLAEAALADGFTQMLYWSIHAKKNIYAWDTTNADKQKVGRELVVKWNEMEPDSIYMSVKLDPKLPIDKVSQLNAGMLMKNLGMPSGRIFEQLNITDPEVVADEAAQEALENAELQKVLKRIGAEGDAEAQAILMQVQMDMQQQQQAAMQPPAPEGGAPMGAEAAMGPAGTTPGQMEQQAMARAMSGMAPDQALGIMQDMFGQAGGQPGFNPAAGGQSPTELAPGVGREQIQGRDRGGTPL